MKKSKTVKALLRVLAGVLAMSVMVSSAAFAAVISYQGPEEGEQTSVQYPEEGVYLDKILVDEENFFTEMSVYPKDENGDDIIHTLDNTVKSSTLLGGTTGADEWNGFLFTTVVFQQGADLNRNRLVIHDIESDPIGEFVEPLEFNGGDINLPVRGDYYPDDEVTSDAWKYQPSVIGVKVTDDYIFLLTAERNFDTGGHTGKYNKNEVFQGRHLYLSVFENTIQRDEFENNSLTLVKKFRILGSTNSDVYNFSYDHRCEMEIIDGVLMVWFPTLLKSKYIALDVSSEAAIMAHTDVDETIQKIDVASMLSVEGQDASGSAITTLNIVSDVEFEGNYGYVIGIPNSQNAKTTDKSDIARIDFSDPFNPVLVNSVKVEGMAKNGSGYWVGKRLQIQGDYGYVTDYLQPTGAAKSSTDILGITTLDMSDRDNISVITTFSPIKDFKFANGSVMHFVGNYGINYSDSYGNKLQYDVLRFDESRENIEALLKGGSMGAQNIALNFEAMGYDAIQYKDKLYIPYALSGRNIGTTRKATLTTYNPDRAVIGVMDLGLNFQPAYAEIDGGDAKNVAPGHAITGKVYNVSDVIISVNGEEEILEVEYTTDVGVWSYNLPETEGDYEVKVYIDGYPEYYDYAVYTVGEVATPVETGLSFTTAVSGQTITATVTASNGTDTDMVGVPILAVYSGIDLVAAGIGETATITAQTPDVAAGTASVTVPSGTTVSGLNARVFFWNSMSGIMPIINSVSGTIE